MNSNKNIPAKARHMIPNSVQITQTQTTLHSGPLPSADELAKYEQLQPGLIAKIVETADKEQDHRFYLQKEEISQQAETLEISRSESKRSDYALKIYSRNSLLGLIFAFLIALAVLAATVLCIYLNHPIPGYILGSGGVVMIVYIFISGSNHLPKNDIKSKQTGGKSHEHREND